MTTAQSQLFGMHLVAARLPQTSRAWKLLRRQWIGGGGPAGHPIAVQAFRSVWPPFYSLALFRPRILVAARNGGDELPGWSLVVYVTRYDGPLSRLSQDARDWTEARRINHLDEPWSTLATRHEWIKLDSSAFPLPSNYVMRLRFVRNDPMGNGMWGGNEILEHDLATYFRIEPLVSVLTFLLVVGTILTALGTLALALR